jgi:hypothetical protein
MKRSFTIPDSVLNQCPACKAGIKVQPTSVFGDFQCKNCEKKLWYLAAGDSPRFFDHEQSTAVREYVIQFLADKLDLDHESLASDPDLLYSGDADSLQRIEMLTELEDELKRL